MSKTNTIKTSQQWLILFFVATLIALLNFARFVTNELAEGEPGKLRFFFIMETTGAYTVLLLSPLLLHFFRKFPLGRANWPARIPVYLLASMVFGVSHTSLMYLTRNLIYWLFDLGVYDYGRLSYRYFMEYSHQFLTFWVIWAVMQLLGYAREHQKQKLKAAELEQQLTQARLQALQMQLNPHFLFNTLNMISSVIYDDPKIADKMIASLSDLLRATLNGAAGHEITLAQELELLQRYVAIMKARFQDKLELRLDVEAVTRNALVPGFILQPLVENAIKYSLENLQRAEVEIAARVENEDLVLEVKDNGPGLGANPSEHNSNGVGLANTAERLEKMYGGERRLLLENRPAGGLQATLTLPLLFAALPERMTKGEQPRRSANERE